ncbi:PLP-dependent aminotransferase family protein [Halomonas dongshanensis]|uniref:PLP-dependent aminotransferase family protein n=1 Tax=Halomonas dongshanensis TaxID=2890835 RepID=A0ABT2EDA3_9GAMM|nr:PLP-dependent aminotransferase family protein [Halomonas dongshanensis]MCS2609569.1 PLP-dependent aminotransferase family protein [Halomonas dongshanensis]
MLDHHFHLDFEAPRGLQEQLREALLASIHTGTIPRNEALPSCRKLSLQLGVSRNTVALVYEGLVEDGYLISRPRSGYYLHDAYHGAAALETPAAMLNEDIDAPQWDNRFTHRPSHLQGVLRPSNWMHYEFPFVYGQLNTRLFPLEQWRESSRQLLGGRRDRHWLGDRYDQDDPMLIEQLRTRVLPKRGIHARSDEILITLGSQNALFLIAQLLFDARTRVAVENPGYREAVNVFLRQGAQLSYQAIDAEGICLDANAADSDYLYVTPSHQGPTGVTMSRARRDALIEQIQQRDQIVLEDDYDAEFNFDRHALPALKSSRAGSRVIYMSSLSKPLSPGLRLGYLVADAELIDELRALRRLMYRHPPSSLQQQVAQFLSQGHYDRYLRLFAEEMYRRWETMDARLRRELPTCRRVGGDHASVFWLEAPETVDTQRLAWQAAQHGVLIEPGFQHFFDHVPPRNFMRLGFGAIDVERIGTGIERLARAFG